MFELEQFVVPHWRPTSRNWSGTGFLAPVLARVVLQIQEPFELFGSVQWTKLSKSSSFVGARIWSLTS
jgi:hypothetical protein